MRKLKLVGIFFLIFFGYIAVITIVGSIDYGESEPKKTPYELQQERLVKIKKTKTDTELTVAFHYCDMMINTDHVKCLLDFLTEKGRAGANADVCYRQYVAVGGHCPSYTESFGTKYPR